MSLRRSLSTPILLAIAMITLLVVVAVGWVLVLVFDALKDAQLSGVYWALLAIGSTFILLLVVGVVLYLILSIKAINLTRRQSNFIDSVTHELKSPMASMKLYLQTLSRHQVSEQLQADFHRFMLEDLERLDHLINQMLDAGRLDAEPSGNEDEEEVELAELLRSCAASVCMNYRVPADTVRLDLAAEHCPWAAGGPGHRLSQLDRQCGKIRGGAAAGRGRPAPLGRWPGAGADRRQRFAASLPTCAARYSAVSCGWEWNWSEKNPAPDWVCTSPARWCGATAAASASAIPKQDREACLRCNCPAGPLSSAERRLIGRSVGCVKRTINKRYWCVSRTLLIMSNNEHILVVEDEEHLATGIKYNLVAEGYRVTIVGDGPSALRIMQESPPSVDLVILDLMLPGMSGYAVCEALRAFDMDTPVLILTARTLTEDRTRGFDAGANQYLTKPFDLDEFLSRVKNLLAFHGRRQVRQWKQAGKIVTFEFAAGQDQLRDLRGICPRRAGPLDATGDDLAPLFCGERGPGDSPPRVVGKRVGRAGHVEHAGARPIHPSAAEDVRARPGPAPAFPHHPRRGLSVRGQAGGERTLTPRRRRGRRGRRLGAVSQLPSPACGRGSGGEGGWH